MKAPANNTMHLLNNILLVLLLWTAAGAVFVLLPWLCYEIRRLTRYRRRPGL